MLTLEAFFDGAATTSSTRRQSCPGLGLGGIGDRFIGVSPCLCPNTKSAIGLLNTAFVAASGSRWHVLVWRGSVRPMIVPLGPSKSDAAMAPADQVYRAETIPAVSRVGYAAV